MDVVEESVGGNVDVVSGLIQGVEYLPSPHCDERPDAADISLIVVHSISLPPGEFGTGDIQSFFCGKLDFTKHPYFQSIADLRVSAHLLISRDGALTQFVPFCQRAWHAGESSYQGRSRCNDFSVGIELEGVDDIPYEPAQYQALAKVIKALQRAYPAIKDNIIGHEDIAPGRKTDPGPAFDWQTLKGLLQ